MTDEPSVEALAEQIGAVEETIAELQADPLLYHVQAGPVIDLRIARLTAVIATLKERDAVYRRGIEEGRKLTLIRKERPGFIVDKEDCDALAPPQEES